MFTVNLVNINLKKRTETHSYVIVYITESWASSTKGYKIKFIWTNYDKDVKQVIDNDQKNNVLTNKQQRRNQDGQQFDTHNHRYSCCDQLGVILPVKQLNLFWYHLYCNNKLKMKCLNLKSTAYLNRLSEDREMLVLRITVF